ncbi:MAG: four helix bundle protein [Bacteroidota bacterium]
MKQELIDSNPILKLSFDFSLAIIEYSELLESLRRFNLSNQLFRSGTSIGANAMEAQNAESKADFIHKMKIAAKESEETQYWLLICRHAKNYPDCEVLIDKLEAISKILSKILQSSKKNNPLSFMKASISFFVLNLLLHK